MRSAWLCIFLFQLALPTLAQTSDWDELPLPALRQKLAASREDTTKVQLQLALGHLMFYKPTRGEKDIDSAVRFAAQADELSRRLNYHFGILNAMLLRVESYYARGEGQLGLKIAQSALDYAQKDNNSDGEARSYHLIAKYYPTSDPAALQKRISFFNKAITIFRKNRNNHWLSTLLTDQADMLFQSDRITEGLRLLFEALNLRQGVSRRTVEGGYFNIGRISYKLGDYKNSLKYNLLAIATAREVNDTTLQACVINQFIAATYMKMGDYRRAIPYSMEVMWMGKRYNDQSYFNTGCSTLALEYTRTNQFTKALTVLQEMKSRAVTNLDQLSVIVEFVNDVVIAKRLGKAAQYVQELKSLLPKISGENVKELMNAYNALAFYYSQSGQVKLAYYYTELYAAMAHKLNYAAGIRTAEYRYYKLISLKGDKKSAMAHFLKEKAIKDSIENVAKAYQLTLLNIENEALEKNRHIDSLTRDALVKEDKLNRNRLLQKVTIGGAFLLLVITALIYSRYRLKQRSNALLVQQKSEIDQQNISLKHLISDKNHLLDEKDLLLKEVNHRVKNNLQIVMSLLASQAVYMSVEGAQQAILEGQNRVRSIALIHDQLYKTDSITEIDLSVYIKELIESLDESLNRRSYRIAIAYEVDNITLDVSQAIPVGIILNEIVTNALKYAFPDDQTGTIMILVKRVQAFVEMQVRDNGIGLPTDFSLSSMDTLGITLLEGLTAQLQGSFHIESNKGLTVFLKFPIKFARIPAQVPNT